MRSAIRREPGVSNMRLLKWSVISFIYLFAAALTFPAGVYIMPDLESAWWPPIRDQKISNVHYAEDPHYLLWEWSFVKERKALPWYVTFMAYSDDNELARYAIDTYVGWDCKDNIRSDRSNLPSPERVSRKLCVKLPNELAGRTDVRVEGVIDFKVGHDFYTVPVKIPADASASIPAPLASPR